jgi:hypothetical protein
MTSTFRPGLVSVPVGYVPPPGAQPVEEHPPAVSITFTAEARVVDADEARRLVPISSRTHLLSLDGEWTWEQLRDYVIGQIHARWGAQPRDALRESGIFKGFVNRWGVQAGPIAKAAFEIHGGVWKGAPISVSRFAKGSDPYFAEVIAKNI